MANYEETTAAPQGPAPSAPAGSLPASTTDHDATSVHHQNTERDPVVPEVSGITNDATSMAEHGIEEHPAVAPQASVSDTTNGGTHTMDPAPVEGNQNVEQSSVGSPVSDNTNDGTNLDGPESSAENQNPKHPQTPISPRNPDNSNDGTRANDTNPLMNTDTQQPEPKQHEGQPEAQVVDGRQNEAEKHVDETLPTGTTEASPTVEALPKHANNNADRQNPQPRIKPISTQFGTLKGPSPETDTPTTAPTTPTHDGTNCARLYSFQDNRVHHEQSNAPLLPNANVESNDAADSLVRDAAHRDSFCNSNLGFTEAESVGMGADQATLYRKHKAPCDGARRDSLCEGNLGTESESEGMGADQATLYRKLKSTYEAIKHALKSTAALFGCKLELPWVHLDLTENVSNPSSWIAGRTRPEEVSGEDAPIVSKVSKSKEEKGEAQSLASDKGLNEIMKQTLTPEEVREKEKSRRKEEQAAELGCTVKQLEKAGEERTGAWRLVSFSTAQTLGENAVRHGRVDLLVPGQVKRGGDCVAGGAKM